MTIHLRPGRYPIVVEIHAPFTWPDRTTGKPESYLAGFPDPNARAKAVSYAQQHGWVVTG